jgi:hypothetical protein
MHGQTIGHNMKTPIATLFVLFSILANADYDNESARRLEQFDYDLKHAGDSSKEQMREINEWQHDVDQELTNQDARYYYERERMDRVYGNKSLYVK